MFIAYEYFQAKQGRSTDTGETIRLLKSWTWVELLNEFQGQYQGQFELNFVDCHLFLNFCYVGIFAHVYEMLRYHEMLFYYSGIYYTRMSNGNTFGVLKMYGDHDVQEDVMFKY